MRRRAARRPHPSPAPDPRSHAPRMAFLGRCVALLCCSLLLSLVCSPGCALTHLPSPSPDSTTSQISALRIAILEELGWVHWAHYKRAWAIVSNPRDYALF